MYTSGRKKACLQMLPELLDDAAELSCLPGALFSNPLVHGCHFVLLIQLTLQSLLGQGTAVLIFFEQQLQLLHSAVDVAIAHAQQGAICATSSNQPALAGGRIADCFASMICKDEV